MYASGTTSADNVPPHIGVQPAHLALMANVGGSIASGTARTSRRTSRVWAATLRTPVASAGRTMAPSPLNSLMAFWGNEAGLSVETIQMALQAHLFKHIGRRNPTLRFSISQGSDPRDPVMIKVPHPAGV